MRSRVARAGLTGALVFASGVAVGWVLPQPAPVKNPVPVATPSAPPTGAYAVKVTGGGVNEDEVYCVAPYRLTAYEPNVDGTVYILCGR